MDKLTCPSCGHDVQRHCKHACCEIIEPGGGLRVQCDCSRRLEFHAECAGQYETFAHRLIENLAPDNIPPVQIPNSAGALRRPKDNAMRRICPTALRELGKIYFEGIQSYESEIPYNWCRGIGYEALMEGIDNHLSLYRLGHEPIRNLAKVMWGVAALIHYEANCNHHLVALEKEKQFTGEEYRVKE